MRIDTTPGFLGSEEKVQGKKKSDIVFSLSRPFNIDPTIFHVVLMYISVLFFFACFFL